MEGQPETTSPCPSLPTETLFKIFGDLDGKSLLLCRMISQHWCEASSTIFQSRPNVLVRPSRRLDVTNEDSIASFIDCFRGSKEFGHSFPCFNFIFKAEELEYSAELEAFFDLMMQPSSDPDLASDSGSDPDSGSELLIKSLHVDDIKNRENPIADLSAVLFRKIPELSKLNLRFCPDVNDQEPCGCSRHRPHSSHKSRPRKCSKPRQDWPGGNDWSFYNEWRFSPNWSDHSEWTRYERDLPCLRVLQLENCAGRWPVKIVSKILKAGHRLQRIEGTGYSEYNGDYHYRVFHKDHLEALMHPKSLHLIEQCKMMLDAEFIPPGQLGREKLSRLQPKVVVVALDPRRFVGSNDAKTRLLEVLRIVKDSVEDLRSEESFHVLNHADLPVFTKLKRLNWKIKRMQINGDAFPKLEKICLSLLDTFGQNNWIFPVPGFIIPVIPSVHSLELEAFGLFNEAFWESMAQMCPNLRHLKLFFGVANKEFEVSSVGPVIWNGMRQLKTLELNNILPKKMDSMERMEMEAWFTGFSLLTVYQLECAKPEARPKAEAMEHLRVNPSILQLKELTKLVIGHKGRGQVPVIPFSLKYAFDIMPGLSVYFSRTTYLNPVHRNLSSVHIFNGST